MHLNFHNEFQVWTLEELEEKCLGFCADDNDDENATFDIEMTKEKVEQNYENRLDDKQGRENNAAENTHT
jgi:hypothetical protein